MPANRRDTVSRAYKACLSCRKRKIRCNLGPSNQAPCQRCQRESRDCIVPEERSWKRQNETPRRGPSSNDGFEASHTGHYGTLSSNLTPGMASRAPQNNSFEAATRSTSAPAPASNAGLENAIVTTTVTNGNDALGLLFSDIRSGQTTTAAEPVNGAGPASTSVEEPVAAQSHRPSFATPGKLHPLRVGDEVKNAWKSSKLGQMGWLRAHEVTSLVDSFLDNLAPLTPITSDQHHRDLRDHAHLITNEPLLCAVILMISSRYNSIPGPTSLSHAFHIHSCIWRYCQKMVTALIFGQSRLALGSDTSYGTIMALLLLCEWHPRAFHFSPDADGLGGFAMPALGDDSEQEEPTAHERWLSQVHEAVQCSDRMSTMLVGCSLTLAHELHLFDDADERGDDSVFPVVSPQQAHVRHLVYLYTHLLADKPSFTSLLPEKVSQLLAENGRARNATDRTHGITKVWLELSDLWKSFQEMAPTTKATASGSTRTRKCLSLVDHFTSLLTQWSDRHVHGTDMTHRLQKILAIEYNYAQVRCNSFGMQVQVERMQSSGQIATPGLASDSSSMDTSTAVATTYAENVTTHCCALLSIIVDMHTDQALRYAPVRVFMRTVAASVLLLKTLAIGVRTRQLKSALDLLDRVVKALESSAIDDVHLARHYATLLNSCLQRARSSFSTASMRPASPAWASPTQTTAPQGNQTAPAATSAEFPEQNDTTAAAFGLDGDDWWALPFGPENDIFSDLFPGDHDMQTFGYMGSGLMNFP